MQFNAALAITGVNRDSVPEKLYQGLEPEYLHDRRWMRRLCLFYKVLLIKVPKYIYRFILPFRHSFRNPNLFTSFTCRNEYFKSSFLPSVINDWNKLDPKIRNSTTYLNFKKCPNKFYQTFRERKSSIFMTRSELNYHQITISAFSHFCGYFKSSMALQYRA